MRFGGLCPAWRMISFSGSHGRLVYINGVSTRKVDDLIKALGCSGISASEVSRLCTALDADVAAFRNRPLTKHIHYLWLDATWIKVREGGRFVSKAVVIAAGVNTDGTRELLGVGIDLSESEAIVSSRKNPKNL
jgi:putative transposase